MDTWVTSTSWLLGAMLLETGVDWTHRLSERQSLCGCEHGLSPRAQTRRPSQPTSASSLFRPYPGPPCRPRGPTEQQEQGREAPSFLRAVSSGLPAWGGQRPSSHTPLSPDPRPQGLAQSPEDVCQLSLSEVLSGSNVKEVCNQRRAACRMAAEGPGWGRAEPRPRTATGDSHMNSLGLHTKAPQGNCLPGLGRGLLHRWSQDPRVTFLGHTQHGHIFKSTPK
ncbi:uncharacterized protein LOC124965650 [Sciurus carolinensis]|uniref:uncharacterized protein LOC124965650 n=1 Tax=Sciurus carolinensis TaxID=30640 RepID=UPI001FB3DFFD|nr:uncharacterized protein LOC124965650 [Sciurus carolinensis]